MARVNAFLSAGNDNRSVSVGGRSRSDRVWARMNTDNGGKSDVSLLASVEVVGQKNRNGKPRKTCHTCDYEWKIGYYTHKVRGIETKGYVHGKKNTWHEGDDDLKVCPTCGVARQGIDTRKSIFNIELPEQTDPNYCEVRIRPHGAGLGDIARIGAMLCVIKGVTEIAAGKEHGNEDLIGHGKKAIEFARETFTAMDEKLKGREYANVILPGGISLAKALACVEIVRRIADGSDHS